MEDAPAFITVTADPKHHRYEPPSRGHPLHGAAWRRETVSPVLCLGSRGSMPSRGVTLRACPPATRLLSALTSQEQARLRMAPAVAKQARRGRCQACAAVKLSPLPQQMMWAGGEPGWRLGGTSPGGRSLGGTSLGGTSLGGRSLGGTSLGGRSLGASGSSGEYLAFICLDLLLHLLGRLSGLEAPVTSTMVAAPGSLANAEALGAHAGTPCAEHPLLRRPLAFLAAPWGGAGRCPG